MIVRSDDSSSSSEWEQQWKYARCSALKANQNSKANSSKAHWLGLRPYAFAVITTLKYAPLWSSPGQMWFANIQQVAWS